MKTIRELKIRDWSGYFFKEMVNILDIEPEYFMVNNFKGCDMINNYVKIIDQIGDEIASWIDELEEDDLVKFKADIMKFKFRTDDNLVYNKKINIPVCLISLGSVIKRKNNYYPNFKLQKCFYESFFKKD